MSYSITRKTLTKDNTRFASSTGSKIVDYYTEAGPDYEFWSKNYNMHFGYASKTLDCWSRETMLQRMNEVVLKSLNLQKNQTIVDLGCGLGATLKYGALHNPSLDFLGFTITPWQVKQANDRTGDLPNFHVECADYNNLPLANESIHAAYGIESICHAEGTDKKGPLTEAYRILKKGGRFTMIDGFIKKKESELTPSIFRMYKTVCDNWALPSFPNVNDVHSTLKNIGFRNIIVK